MQDRAFRHDILHLLRMSGIQVQFKAMLHQIAAHGLAHDAGADPADARHSSSPSRSGFRYALALRFISLENSLSYFRFQNAFTCASTSLIGAPFR